MGLPFWAHGGMADYPMERPVIALSLLNPVDLGRILLLLNFDISALMGFTGAVFKQFFGIAATTTLYAWGESTSYSHTAGLPSFRQVCRDFGSWLTATPKVSSDS